MFDYCLLLFNFDWLLATIVVCCGCMMFRVCVCDCLWLVCDVAVGWRFGVLLLLLVIAGCCDCFGCFFCSLLFGDYV